MLAALRERVKLVRKHRENSLVDDKHGPGVGASKATADDGSPPADLKASAHRQQADIDAIMDDSPGWETSVRAC